MSSEMSSAIRLLPASQCPAQGDNVFLLAARWPAGLPRGSLPRARWLPRALPAPGLQAWLRRDPLRYALFCDTYWADLAANPPRWQALLQAAAAGGVVLLYDGEDCLLNPVRVLARFLEARLAAQDYWHEAAQRSSPVCYAGLTH